MSDIVNNYFRRFYPAQIDLSKFYPRSGIGGSIMREYTDKSVSNIFPSIVCADGLTMSVQGHYGAYSHPRDDFAEHYYAVEILGPAVEEFAKFKSDTVDNETLYAYVPVRIVVAVIEKHGGLAAGGEQS